MTYTYLTNLKSDKIKHKSILIIGSGYIAEEYAKAIHKIGIKDVTIIGSTKEKVEKLCKKFDFISLSGGFSKNLPTVTKKDLVIIATPIPLLLKAAEIAMKNGQNNILIEKPGALYSKQLKSFSKKITSQKIRLAYNRLSYPSLYLLKELIKKDGGATSCFFCFTEWIHKINFKSYPKIVYSRWGISNSLHVISMAMSVIGMPKRIYCYQSGRLPWHKSGAIFMGSGMSKKDIPFSYNSDWSSAGRWSIEVMTKKNSYRLIPLESLSVCKKGTTKWKNISFRKSYTSTKDGICEEIFAMLDKNSKINLPTIKEGSEYVELAEKIFGY